MDQGTYTGLLLSAHHKGVEVSLAVLREYDEFSGMSLLDALGEIDLSLAEVGLCIEPPISQGEMDDIRVISAAKTVKKYHQLFDDALAADEGQEVEFKESLYVKKRVLGNAGIPKKSWVSEEIVFECIRTICAFLNADGGTLLIGVDDNRNVQGIECEFDHVKNADGSVDKWELFFSECLRKYIYDYTQCVGFISRNVIEVDGKSVCVVSVRPRRNNITVCRSPNDANEERVFVRNGNGSTELKARAIVELVRSRL